MVRFGLGRVVGADGAVDFAVHLGGFLQVLRVGDGEAAGVVEVGGDGLHQRGEDGVAGGAGDGAVEADVVDEVLVGVGERGVHLGDLFGEFGDVLVGGALGGERGDEASRTRRASNICQGRKPCSAPSTVRELESSAGGPLETKVPAPWRLLSTPMAERKPMPARSEERLIFSSRASSRSGGRRSPGRSSPLAIRARTWSTTCRVSWLWPPGFFAGLLFSCALAFRPSVLAMGCVEAVMMHSADCGLRKAYRGLMWIVARRLRRFCLALDCPGAGRGVGR